MIKFRIYADDRKVTLMSFEPLAILSEATQVSHPWKSKRSVQKRCPKPSDLVRQELGPEAMVLHTR